MHAVPRPAAVRVAVVTVAFVALSTGPLYRLRTWWDHDTPLSTDAVVVLVHAAFGVIAAAWLVTGGRWRRLDPWATAALGGLCGWYLLGSLWSDAPGATAREALQIASALAVGAAAVAATGWRWVQWALWAALQIGLAWSFVAIADHRPRTVDHRGDWAGIHVNRNSLALYAVLAIVVGAALLWGVMRSGHSGRWRAVLTALLVLAALADARLLAGSDSLAPLLAAVAAVVALIILLTAGRAVHAGDGTVTAVVGASLAAVVITGFLTRSAWLPGFGRRSDLTGRSVVWELAIERGWDRPLHGFGYLTSWRDPAFIATVEAAGRDLTTSAHNSFVEAFVGGGLSAVVLLAAAFALLFRRAALVALGGRGPDARTPFVLLVFVLVENFAETLFVGNQLTVALLGAVLVVGSVPAREVVVRPPAAPAVNRDDRVLPRG